MVWFDAECWDFMRKMLQSYVKREEEFQKGKWRIILPHNQIWSTHWKKIYQQKE